MDQAPDTASIKKKLETIAERDNVPIIRAAERDLLLEAAEPVMPGRILEIGTAIGYSALLWQSDFLRPKSTPSKSIPKDMKLPFPP